jgi:hypothetical protein
MKMKPNIVSLVIGFSTTVFAQDSTKQQINHLTFSGYIEPYYGYDFNKPRDNNRPSFVYSYNRHNEFNVNLAYLKASYNEDRVRGNFAIAAGTYMNANYSSEPGVLKNIFEADAGFKISKKKNLWLDAGIMPSHIGFESAVGKNCWNLTRSIVADNTPFFESGAKISFTTDDSKWLFSIMGLNGWQRITRVAGNSLMSGGTQITFTPSSKTSINYSTFFGTDLPDSVRAWRYYHNLYGIFQLTEKIGLILNLDFGQQQSGKGSSTLYAWYSPVAIVRFTPTAQWAIAVRGEYFSDEHGIMIRTNTPNGFKTFGASFNIDRNIGDHFVWRTEIKTLSSKDAVFVKLNTMSTTYNTVFTTSFAVAF